MSEINQLNILPALPSLTTHQKVVREQLANYIAEFTLGVGVRTEDDQLDSDVVDAQCDWLADLILDVCSRVGDAYSGYGPEGGARQMVFGEDFDYTSPDNPDGRYMSTDPMQQKMYFRNGVWEPWGGMKSLHRTLIERLRERGWIN